MFFFVLMKLKFSSSLVKVTTDWKDSVSEKSFFSPWKLSSLKIRLTGLLSFALALIVIQVTWGMWESAQPRETMKCKSKANLSSGRFTGPFPPAVPTDLSVKRLFTLIRQTNRSFKTGFLFSSHLRCCSDRCASETWQSTDYTRRCSLCEPYRVNQERDYPSHTQINTGGFVYGCFPSTNAKWISWSVFVCGLLHLTHEFMCTLCVFASARTLAGWEFKIHISVFDIKTIAEYNISLAEHGSSFTELRLSSEMWDIQLDLGSVNN